MTSAAAQNAVLADTLGLIKAHGSPVTKRAVAEAYRDMTGDTLAYDWAFEQLERRGWIKRVANTPGVHCVDGRYVATRPGTGR